MKRNFTSLDRYDVDTCEVRQPDRYREFRGWKGEGTNIPQGAGLSYVSAGFGGGSTVLDMRRFNRILAFNPEEAWMEVEVGASIGGLYSFLKGHGLCIPTLPGHPSLTIGGCIAVNVFGKNQTKEGLFENAVRSLKVFHPDHGVLETSRENNPELFELTVGGFGLTGVILSAVISLSRTPGSGVLEKKIPVANLKECFSTLREMADQEDLLYSWNNFSGKAGGRGFVITGKFRSHEEIAEDSWQPLDLDRSKNWPNAFNALSLKCLNTAYEWMNLKWKPEREISYFEYCFPVANKIMYFHLFGKVGFRERQFLIPFDATDSYLTEFDRIFNRHRPLVTLCSCKVFKGEQSLLHFNGNGIVLSLDLPAHDRYMDFHRELFQLNIEHGVIDNLAKDSLVDLETLRQEYPEYETFRDKLHNWDPKRHFQSELSKRLGL